MIRGFLGIHPRIDPSCYIAETAVIIGDVKLGAHSSIWHNVTIRGDVNWIKIGSESNIQDNSVIHVTSRTGPVQIGNQVTVGHGVILHACTIQNLVLVGMGSVILDYAEIGHESIIGAGALVTQRTQIPPRSLVLGHPARVIRELAPEEIESIHQYAENYVRYSAIYRGEETPSINPFYTRKSKPDNPESPENW